MEKCPLNDFFSPAQRARFLEAVAKRRSVRAYRMGPDMAQLSALHFAAARVCLPGVRIVLHDAEPELLFRRLPMVGGISGTNKYAAVIADDSVTPRAALHAGISGEAFVLEATAMGLGTCWVASFRKNAVDIPLNPHEKVLAVTPLGVSNEVSSGRKRKKLTEICVGDPASWPLWAYHAAECVRQAPSAVNLQPWRLAYAGRTLMLMKGGVGGSALDLGIALLHMSLGVGDKPHEIQWGEGKEIASLIAEDEA
ncbi:MAG: nitroreductase family protein [Clostridia bacterium]|nr:nitroreductase family protein [Clostridia bacterium]